MTLPMSSLFEKDVNQTGSISSLPETVAVDVREKLSALDEEDWRRASSAMGLALDPQGPGTPVTWDNPDSNHKGIFKPSGAPFVENNEICRLFETEMDEQEIKSSYSGKACKASGENWTILSFEKTDKSLKF